VHHQVDVCYEFDVLCKDMYSPMMRSCLWAWTQMPDSHRNFIFDITKCEQLHLLCVISFFLLINFQLSLTL
jgi:hypothetical protein